MTNTETTTETIPPYLYDDLRPQGAIGDQCSMLLSAKKHDSLKSCFYDGDGLRISRTDNVSGLTTYYVWDSENPTGYPQVVEEIEEGQVVRRYGYGLFLENVDIWNGSAFDRFYVVRDGTNSVRMLLDSAGNVAAEYDYDAFGNILRSTINAPLCSQNAYGFHSEYKDPTTGLVYLRARWYDSRDGRFVGMDKYEGKRKKPNTLNKYVFADNDGINKMDPLGLYYSSVTAFITSDFIGILSSLPNVKMDTDNEYKEGMQIIHYGKLLHYMQEGMFSLSASMVIDGYYKINKKTKTSYNMQVVLFGSTGASASADTINWSGSVSLIVNDKKTSETSLSVDRSEPMLLPTKYDYIGEAKLLLPQKGNVKMRLFTDYFFNSFGEGGAPPMGDKNETIQIYP